MRPAPFRARPDSVSPGDLRGPYDGRAVDADTDKPVAGALVYAVWTYVEGTGVTAPAGHQEWVGTTDANGRYVIPALAPRRDDEARLAGFHLLVYKKGYVAWRSDRRFDDFGTRTDFAQRENRVELERWRSDISHVRHLSYMGGGGPVVSLAAWEIPEAAAELAEVRGGRPAVVTRPPAPTPGEEPAALDASALLTVEEIRKVTGYAGEFDVGPLADQPSTEQYDSAHFKARELPEAYDVALRVWRMPPGEAQQHFGALAKELPNAEARNEIGDRSLRAISDRRDILALAYLDGRRGVVVLLTCGASQCGNHEKTLDLVRIVKARLDATGATP